MGEQAANIESGLVKRICAGDQSSWNDLICTYQNRLFVFAHRQVDRHEDADDLVQETFLSFLNVVNDYRQDCELETYLFQILRRRIVDFYRARGRSIDARVCVYNESLANDPSNSQMVQHLDPAEHWQRTEQLSEAEHRLSAAIRQVTEQLCQRNKFRDLQIAEATLYANLGNQEVARVVACKPREVAVVKCRIINRLAQTLSSLTASEDMKQVGAAMSPGVLTRVWESQRPSCPKRTTLGKSIFRLLPPQWAQHIRFHVDLLGCRFCQANLDELNGLVSTSKLDTTDRLFQSTVGFI